MSDKRHNAETSKKPKEKGTLGKEKLNTNSGLIESKQSYVSSDKFASAIAATNSNISRFSKTMASTANTLVNNNYNDLSMMAQYRAAVNDLSPALHKPSFKKHLFSFSKPISEKSSFSFNELQYKASYIPDSLLKQIPNQDNTYSLFQGFKATSPSLDVNNNTNEKKKLISWTKDDLLSKDSNELEVEKDKLLNSLELLEIRKDIAASEIKNIDSRIKHLEDARTLVFNRMANLEQEEIIIEKQLKNIESIIEEEAFKESITQSIKNMELSNDNKDNENISDIENNDIKNESQPQSPIRYKQSVKRRTLPTLHQYYKPNESIRTFKCHTDTINDLDFDIPFGTMVTAGMDDAVCVWDLNKGEKEGSLIGHNAPVKCLQIESNFVVTGSIDATIRLWDINKLSKYNTDNELCLYTFASHMDEITAINMNGNNLVSGSQDKTIRQWDLQTGKCVQTIDVMFTVAHNVSSIGLDKTAARATSEAMKQGFSFVGALQCFDAALATGTADGIVRLWDLRTGQVQRTLIGHTGPVTTLQFDQNYIVTGSADRSVRIWDLRTGSISDAFAYDNPISSLQFDDRHIVTATGKNTVMVYDRDSEHHWPMGPGVKDENAAVVKTVRLKENYLVEGRCDGNVGTWAC